MDDQLSELAKQALCVMVYDLRYSNEPRHGHDAMRHQFLWMFCEKALGESFKPEVKRLVDSMNSRNAKGTGWRVRLSDSASEESEPPPAGPHSDFL